MISAFLVIVATQLALAGLLFGTVAMDSHHHPLTAVRARFRRRRGELASLEDHRRLVSGLQRAAQGGVASGIGTSAGSRK